MHTSAQPVRRASRQSSRRRAAALVRSKKPRRALAATALIAGALLMWLSPEALGGALLMAAGISLEILGVWLEHRA